MKCKRLSILLFVLLVMLLAVSFSVPVKAASGSYYKGDVSFSSGSIFLVLKLFLLTWVMFIIMILRIMRLL